MVIPVTHFVIGTKMAGSRRESKEKCSAGAYPQLGAGCVAQTTPDPSINQCTQFSYLRVPAPAGMSDCHESMSRTTIRDRLPTRRSGGRKPAPVPRYGAGIQGRSLGGAIGPSITSTRPAPPTVIPHPPGSTKGCIPEYSHLESGAERNTPSRHAPPIHHFAGGQDYGAVDP